MDHPKSSSLTSQICWGFFFFLGVIVVVVVGVLCFVGGIFRFANFIFGFAIFGICWIFVCVCACVCIDWFVRSWH